MPRRTHTYVIRLAVEGGGKVKAELVSALFALTAGNAKPAFALGL